MRDAPEVLGSSFSVPRSYKLIPAKLPTGSGDIGSSLTLVVIACCCCTTLNGRGVPTAASRILRARIVERTRTATSTSTTMPPTMMAMSNPVPIPESPPPELCA